MQEKHQTKNAAQRMINRTLSMKERDKMLNDWLEQSKPKPIRQYQESGNQITVYEAR